MHFPLAYHVTWGTHGARLHGSDKPHVDRDQEQYGEPFAPTDPEREDAARRRMNGAPVPLNLEQRKEVERAMQEVADRYGRAFHAKAVQSDHAHVVITAPRDGPASRDALKAVASPALDERFGPRTWWAEKGSASRGGAAGLLPLCETT